MSITLSQADYANWLDESTAATDNGTAYPANLGQGQQQYVALREGIELCIEDRWLHHAGSTMMLMALLLEDLRTAPSQTSAPALNPDDVERIHYASKLLRRQLTQPPTLLNWRGPWASTTTSSGGRSQNSAQGSSLVLVALIDLYSIEKYS